MKIGRNRNTIQSVKPDSLCTGVSISRGERARGEKIPQSGVMVAALPTPRMSVSRKMFVCTSENCGEQTLKRFPKAICLWSLFEKEILSWEEAESEEVLLAVAAEAAIAAVWEGLPVVAVPVSQADVVLTAIHIAATLLVIAPTDTDTGLPQFHFSRSLSL